MVTLEKTVRALKKLVSALIIRTINVFLAVERFRETDTKTNENVSRSEAVGNLQNISSNVGFKELFPLFQIPNTYETKLKKENP